MAKTFASTVANWTSCHDSIAAKIRRRGANPGHHFYDRFESDQPCTNCAATAVSRGCVSDDPIHYGRRHRLRRCTHINSVAILGRVHRLSRHYAGLRIDIATTLIQRFRRRIKATHDERWAQDKIASRTDEQNMTSIEAVLSISTIPWHPI